MHCAFINYCCGQVIMLINTKRRAEISAFWSQDKYLLCQTNNTQQSSRGCVMLFVLLVAFLSQNMSQVYDIWYLHIWLINMFHYVYITIFILKADHHDAKSFFFQLKQMIHQLLSQDFPTFIDNSKYHYFRPFKWGILRFCL